MDSNRNWNDIGNELRGALEHTIRTGDFSDFANVVTDTVSGVVDEARRQARQGRDFSGTQTRGSYSERTATYRTHGTTYEYRRQQWNNNSKCPPQTPYGNGQVSGTLPKQRGLQAPKTIFKRKGDISSIVWTVFGGIGTALAAVAFLIFGIIALLLLRPAAVIIGMVIILLLLGGSIAMIIKGTSNRKRLSRAERYMALCQNHDYINLSELAEQTGKSVSFVRRDVKNMVGAGLFPQGHLDKQENCLMLSDDTYREYLAIEKERTNYEMEEFAKQQRQNWRGLSKIEDADAAVKEENPDLAALIAQGQECTGRIRQMNEQIPGEVISEKLYALEHVLKEIFDRVREHPEQMPKMKKFMDYYLPTTLKLVEAYEEFDSVPNPNEEIIQAKDEIEKTLDTINASFTELLNQLYQPSVLDATTDAKVLQTVLAKDGLAKDHAFK
jgi:DNA-binding transcriptional regulator GbsR (MarR family)